MISRSITTSIAECLCYQEGLDNVVDFREERKKICLKELGIPLREPLKKNTVEKQKYSCLGQMFCNRLPSSDDSYAKKWQTAALFVVGVAGREREGRLAQY